MKRVTHLLGVLGATVLLILANGSPASASERNANGQDRVVGVTYREAKDTEFLKAVLNSMNLSYTVNMTPDGELVEWHSNDRSQELEIQNRVSQFSFISKQCKGMQLPSPDQPAVAQLSCRK